MCFTAFPCHFHKIVCLAGQDATEAFYGLHRHEVLERPQYQRLQVGYIDGETPSMNGRTVGQLSKVPYAEPTWLVEAYHSPYYKEVCHGLRLVSAYRPPSFAEPSQVTTSRP